MIDVVFVLLTLGLFAALVGLARAVGAAVNLVNLVGLVLSAGLAVFLLFALLFPERF